MMIERVSRQHSLGYRFDLHNGGVTAVDFGYYDLGHGQLMKSKDGHTHFVGEITVASPDSVSATLVKERVQKTFRGTFVTYVRVNLGAFPSELAALEAVADNWIPRTWS